MAKLALPLLTTLIKAQIAAAKIANPTFTPTYNTLTGLLIKIGKQVHMDSSFEDRLSELEGETLPFGTTIEEYFMDLILPVDYDLSGANNMAPVSRPTYQQVHYSYEQPKKDVQITQDNEVFKNAMLQENAFAELFALITKRLYDSRTLYKYGIKRQALGLYIDKIITTQAATPTRTMVTKIALPTDTTTGEAFVKSVKKVKEKFNLITETNNILGVPAKSDDDNLMLYVKPDILPDMDVSVLAGSFNQNHVAIPVNVKVLEDFGTLTADVNAYAILVDIRGVKLHGDGVKSDTDHNGKGGFTNIYLKEGFTIHHSYVVNAHVWTIPTE